MAFQTIFKSWFWILPIVLVGVFACAKHQDIDESPAPSPVQEVAEIIEDLPVDALRSTLPAPITQPAWIMYAVKPEATLTEDNKIIAIIIDDMGLNKRNSVRATNLPAPVTLAYLPYAHDLELQTSLAREKGHELLVHVPMEPESKATDPGPNHLHTQMDEDLIKQSLQLALSSFEGHVGINNHMGSKLTKSLPHMTVVAEELKRYGLLFLDSRTTAASVAEQAALQAGIPTTSRDVFLDDVATKENVERELARAEKIAQRNGSAVVIGHPKNVTLEALEAWIPTAKEKGFTLVPLSSVIKQREKKREDY